MSQDNKAWVRMAGRESPVLWQGDAIVVGGSFGGIATALALAQAGRRVIIVEPRTYLGRELFATQRPWLNFHNTPIPQQGFIASCLALAGNVWSGDECALHPDQNKIHLEEILDAAGVELLYLSYPVGVLEQDARACGLVIANKSGRQVLQAQLLIDATETALLYRLMRAPLANADHSAIYRRTLEFGHVVGEPPSSLQVPESLGVLGQRVTLHRGAHSEGHWYVDYAVTWPYQVNSLAEASALKSHLEDVGLALTVYLRENVPAFAPPCVVGASSYEPSGPLTRTGNPNTSPIKGLWRLGDALPITKEGMDPLCDALVAAEAGEALAKEILAGDNRALQPREPETPSFRLGLTVREQDIPQRGRVYPLYAVPDQLLPVEVETSVLVVGGGSSGAVAAIAAADEGVSSTVVDMNPGLGGTGTFGGINTYWFCRRFGFVDRLMGWLDEIHDRLHIPRPTGVLAHWNVEARVQALREQAERAGVHQVLGALVFGTVVNGNRVRGVVAATAYGPVALLGQVTLDATGDGDVAAWAGAEVVYGSAREHVVMWGYMPQIAAPDLPRNVKTSMVDTTNIYDMNRMIRAERRRAQPGDYDHGVYLAPRESRHVRGGVTLTLTDQLTRRCWPDVVYIAFSNYDMKGEATSDWVRMGIQPPNLTIEIPYRALVPNGLEDILVVGKAFSATHDALAAPRMQPDLENLGGVAAVAAKMALAEGVSVREVDRRRLQERLVALGVLPAHILTRKLRPLRFSQHELWHLAESITAEKPLHAYSDQEIGEAFEGRIPEVDILCAGMEAVPVLEEALSRAEGPRKVRLAQLLCMLGSRAGASVLVDALEKAFRHDELPIRGYPVKHQGPPPDQGADTEEAHLLYALAMAHDERILPLWARVVDLLANATYEDVFDRLRDRLGYAAAVCYGAERLGDPRAIPILQKLHSYPLFRDHVTTGGHQANYMLERLAYAELLIGRALARCGSPEGYLTLIHYLEDVRSLLAEHAHEELISLSGEDHGKNASAWLNWLEEVGDMLGPVPYRALPEPIAAWGETILIEG